MFKNKLSKYKFLLVLFLPIILAACDNSTGNISPQPVNSSVFPNTVGDKWVYSVYDSLTNSTDTLTVEIVGTNSGSTNATIWYFSSRIYNDSMIVKVNKDTVYFYEANNPTLIDHKIVFPLQVNKYWYSNMVGFDSTIVRSKESVTVPADTYPDAYRLERKWGGLNVYGSSTTWFVNNVGIIKFYRKITGDYFITETWVLLSYTSK